MYFIESSLRRLHDGVSCFVAPSVALRDVFCLLAQIELCVLADLKTIRRGTAMHVAPRRAQFSSAAALPREPVSPFNQTVHR
jgi:hypothetical protein